MSPGCRWHMVEPMNGDDASVAGSQRTTALRAPSPKELGAALAILPADRLAEFRMQLVAAMMTAEQQRSLEPLRSVVRAWYWECLFVRRPGYAERVKEAEEVVKALTGR